MKSLINLGTSFGEHCFIQLHFTHIAVKPVVRIAFRYCIEGPAVILSLLTPGVLVSIGLAFILFTTFIN